MDTDLAPDQQAGRLASLQHGAITRDQAIEAGLTPAGIRHRVQAGRYLRITRGLFVVSGAPESWQRDAMLACLAGPPGTVASHLTAAALLDVGEPPELPHVTVPRRASGRIECAEVHRADIDPEDTQDIAGIPATRPARTVVDCAAVLDQAALAELLDDVLCRRLCTYKDVVAAMERAGRRRAGFAALARALVVWERGAFPGSRAEMRLVRRLVDWGFPRPERQVKIFDASGRFVAKVDVGWPLQRAGLEYYGERRHGPRAEQHDAHRLTRVHATGWRVRVVTKEHLHRRNAQALRLWVAEHLAVPIPVAPSVAVQHLARQRSG